MANLTPAQRAGRERAEDLIALAAPFLDLVLGLGERISRIAEPTDHEYYPVPPGAERGLLESAGDETPGAGAPRISE